MVRRVVAACLVLAGCSQQPGASSDNPLGLKLDENAAVGACLTPEEERAPIERMTPERRRQAIACIQSQAAEQLRPQLPQQVDPVTRLTDITVDGTMLTYHQIVDVEADTITPAMLQQIETRVRASVCGQADMRGTIEFGGGYSYRWNDKEGRLLHEVRIDRCAG